MGAGADGAGAGPDGRLFIGRLHGAYELTPLDGELAIEAAHAIDRLAEIRSRRATYPPDDLALLYAHERGWQRTLTTCVADVAGAVSDASV